MTKYVSFWAQKSLKWFRSFLALETEVMGKFPGPETGIILYEPYNCYKQLQSACATYLYENAVAYSILPT